ncbi:kelch repeat-containing protein [Methanoculleus bourgensis]|uniref:kelch repeat-containing protein n=1 Tax=Methanoculleus bourgensis TaxID=83986 RepID=UPI002492A72A|nr:kelch repeat-containing protein [Methanoculleus bourgensis]
MLIGTASAAAPTAKFSGTPTSGTAPLTVQFTDTSTGSPTGWAWFFGDETYDQAWAQVNACPGWTKRHSHTSVALPNGSIVLMGGYNGTGDNKFLNDTWRSTDYGRTWEEVNASSGWMKRDDHTSVVMPDGSIVLMGGWGYDNHGLTCFNDTWLSTDGGGNWTCVNASSGWAERYGHTAVAVGDSIVLMGGYDDDDNLLNDIWQSTDYGKTWEEVNPSAGWPARRSHTSVAMPDGGIVLMGGYDDDNNFLNDTWLSTDYGEHWELVNASSGWSGRAYHTSVAMPDGSIVLMGGEDDDSEYLNDIWRSTDGGATWTQLPDAGWTGRSCHTSVAMPDGSIVLMGGEGYDYIEYLNDVWRFRPAGSTVQNPTHKYTAPGTYPVALQAFNAIGYDLKTGYITVTEPTPTPTATPTRRPVYSSGGGSGSTGGPGGYNVGGDSVVSMVNVTGTGLKTFIVTGWKQSSPGAGIPPAPGIAYQYIDLVPARFENITGAIITFIIPVAWLDEHGLSPEEIVMYHYNGTAWEALPTTVERTGGGEATFTATSPGFSLFAISGVEQTGEAVTTPTAAQTTAQATAQATAQPTAEQTTAAPAGEPAPDFPLGTIAIVAGVVLLLAAGGFLVRRWWIRRQNPALFRDYD